MSLGKRIAEVRKQKNLSQKDLAEILFVSNNTISSWEIDRTEPSLEILVKLSEVLQCSINFLIHGQETSDLPEEEAVIKLSKDELKYLETCINLVLVQECYKKEVNQEAKEQFIRLKEKMNQNYLENGVFWNAKKKRVNQTDKQMILSRGIREDRKVWLVYDSLDKGEIERVIQPGKLFWSKDRWYCAAFCELRQDIRVFELDRMREYRLMDEKFRCKKSNIMNL